MSIPLPPPAVSSHRSVPSPKSNGRLAIVAAAAVGAAAVVHIAQQPRELHRSRAMPRGNRWGYLQAMFFASPVATLCPCSLPRLFGGWQCASHPIPALVPRSKLRLHHLAVDAISGAVGEVAALVALYPLDTIKVQCQARGASTATVLRDLAGRGPSAALRALYAGCGSAALGAAALGSVYLVAFFAAKRVGHAAVAARQQRQHGAEATEGAETLVAAAAGLAASVLGSVVESPIELFKVRTQAGAADGPVFAQIARTASTQGLGPLYWSLLPFLLKSIPHDIAELVTFSTMSDLRTASAAAAAVSIADPTTAQLPSLQVPPLDIDERKESSSARPGAAQPTAAPATGGQSWAADAGSWLAGMSPASSDMWIGAAAGGSAAVASMPFDVTFTRMNTAAASAAAAGVTPVAAFCASARQIVATGGPQALFAGVLPRLLHTVPAGIVYWMAVEGCRRTLRERCDVIEEAQQQQQQHTPQHSLGLHAAVALPVAAAAAF